MGDATDNAMGRTVNGPQKKEHKTINEGLDTQDASAENEEPLPNGYQENEPVLEKNNWPPEFSKIDFLLLCFSVALFLFDIASDWRLAVSYYVDNNLWLFYVSAGFIVVPSIFSGILSIVWFIMEEKSHEYTNPVRFLFRVLFSFLQLGRVYR